MNSSAARYFRQNVLSSFFQCATRFRAALRCHVPHALRLSTYVRLAAAADKTLGKKSCKSERDSGEPPSTNIRITVRSLITIFHQQANRDMHIVQHRLVQMDFDQELGEERAAMFFQTESHDTHQQSYRQVPTKLPN